MTNNNSIVFFSQLFFFISEVGEGEIEQGRARKEAIQLLGKVSLLQQFWLFCGKKPYLYMLLGHIYVLHVLLLTNLGLSALIIYLNDDQMIKRVSTYILLLNGMGLKNFLQDFRFQNLEKKFGLCSLQMIRAWLYYICGTKITEAWLNKHNLLTLEP